MGRFLAVSLCFSPPTSFLWTKVLLITEELGRAMGAKRKRTCWLRPSSWLREATRNPGFPITCPGCLPTVGEQKFLLLRKKEGLEARASQMWSFENLNLDFPASGHFSTFVHVASEAELSGFISNVPTPYLSLLRASPNLIGKHGTKW